MLNGRNAFANAHLAFSHIVAAVVAPSRHRHSANANTHTHTHAWTEFDKRRNGFHLFYLVGFWIWYAHCRANVRHQISSAGHGVHPSWCCTMPAVFHDTRSSINYDQTIPMPSFFLDVFCFSFFSCLLFGVLPRRRCAAAIATTIAASTKKRKKILVYCDAPRENVPASWDGTWESVFETNVWHPKLMPALESTNEKLGKCILNAFNTKTLAFLHCQLPTIYHHYAHHSHSTVIVRITASHSRLKANSPYAFSRVE